MKYILKNFQNNEQDISISKDTKLIQIEIDKNITYTEGYHKINISFIDDDEIIDLDLRILFDIPYYIKPLISFKKRNAIIPKIINIKELDVELLQNRHERVSEVSFDMEVSNINYFFENSDVYVSRLLFSNSTLNFSDRNTKTIWGISNYQNNQSNVTKFTIDKKTNIP